MQWTISPKRPEGGANLEGYLHWKVPGLFPYGHSTTDYCPPRCDSDFRDFNISNGLHLVTGPNWEVGSIPEVSRTSICRLTLSQMNQ